MSQPEKKSVTPVSLAVDAILATAMTLMKAGDHVVVSGSVFGATLQLFNNIIGKFGVEVTVVEERPGQPGYAARAAAVRAAGATLVEDPAPGDWPALVSGVDPGPLSRVLNLTFTQGSLASLRSGEVLVDSDLARDRGYTLGQSITLTSVSPTSASPRRPPSIPAASPSARQVLRPTTSCVPTSTGRCWC